MSQAQRDGRPYRDSAGANGTRPMATREAGQDACLARSAGFTDEEIDWMLAREERAPYDGGTWGQD